MMTKWNWKSSWPTTATCTIKYQPFRELFDFVYQDKSLCFLSTAYSSKADNNLIQTKVDMGGLVWFDKTVQACQGPTSTAYERGLVIFEHSHVFRSGGSLMCVVSTSVNVGCVRKKSRVNLSSIWEDQIGIYHRYIYHRDRYYDHPQIPLKLSQDLLISTHFEKITSPNKRSEHFILLVCRS
jgi:hypothetical protein